MRAEENLLLAVATLGDVVRQVGDDEAGEPGHGPGWRCRPGVVKTLSTWRMNLSGPHLRPAPQLRGHRNAIAGTQYPFPPGDLSVSDRLEVN